ncbi:MAG: transposase, partial [Clostridia bacterium]
DKEIHKINAIYDNTVVIDKYVIMPNHIHFIIFLQNEGGRPQVAPTISRIIQQFKGQITKKISCSIWQKLYYDHVIRNEEEYKEIWNYIDTNILSQELDNLYNGI